ncbi:hypothetical protein PIB30_061203 [Stylosanthes scabra]|uniref:Uncharacterized protein n=1 Tax=Stylosanthes scabra TaxID=79078 RepID=A0ABU6XIL2_9FABA|nr:hypothetical protein [Stylosanthes scabra]
MRLLRRRSRMTLLGSMRSIPLRLPFRRISTFGRPSMRGSFDEDASGAASWRVLPPARQISCLSPREGRTLKDELSEKSLEHQSALERIAQLEEDNRVLKAQFESSQLSLETEWKRAVAAEGRVGSLAASLKTCQADLSKATEVSEYWRSEWHTLGSEVIEMCQETLDICLDQVSHLYPGVDFSAITLKSRWDPKGRRIFVSQESEVEGKLPSAEEVVLERHPESAAQALQSAAGNTAGEAAGVSGGCPT